MSAVQMAQVDASRGGIPAQPTAFATLAPELMSLFQPPLLPGGEPAATPASARRRGAAPEAAADAGAGAAAAAEGGEQPPPAEAEEEPWGPGSVGAPGSGLTSVGAGAADFSGGLPPPELEQQDWIEDSQQQELGPEGLPAGLSARRVSLTLEAAGGSLVQLGSLGECTQCCRPPACLRACCRAQLAASVGPALWLAVSCRLS